MSPTREARRFCVRGVVQGVGFRPFVYRLAARNALAGWVRNESGEVRIEVEGEGPAIERFLMQLQCEAPPLARIDAIEQQAIEPRGTAHFVVLSSRSVAGERLPVSPDVAVCDACIAEMLDPSNRRFRYAFITCTDCGPRFTVIKAMPYDRERTSMSVFTQCPACLREYHAPDNRRFHSETNSCSVCGPQVWLDTTPHGEMKLGGAPRPVGDAAIAEAAARLRHGEILAIRGLGGFHLAVDATNESAVRRLRERKHREAKPLAVMVATLDAALRLATIGQRERGLLTSPERPIVVLPRREDSGLADSVSPGLDTVGLFIAGTPLHRLLLDEVGVPLVMTSGNLSDEPIATCNEEAAQRLGTVADGLLLHDRDIVARYDDSVVRVAGEHRIMVRRARGYAPLPLRLPVATSVALLAVGPHLKNTFTLASGNDAWVSQHIGDLENVETLTHFRESLDRFRMLFGIEPRCVVRDLHPGYLSSRFAEETDAERIITVQHHHAHVAAVTAEHGITRPVIGLAFDGTGLGDDDCVWGAETLVADLAGYRRLGQLRYAPLPGGDLAARQPWRAALGFLSLEPAAENAFRLAFANLREVELRTARAQIERGVNAPLASSMGRLFDAAAAVLGVRQHSQFEGQAAMELESLAGAQPGEVLPFPVTADGKGWVMDPLPLLTAIGERALVGEDRAALAAAFHDTVAHAAAEIAANAAEVEGIDTVALGGGVFQNARLLSTLVRKLEEKKLRVLFARELGPNDGAISYGQAAIAAAILARSV